MDEPMTQVSLGDLNDTFSELSGLFKNSENSWRLAQSLDTILDYFHVNPEQAPDFIPIILDRYHDYEIDPKANVLAGDPDYQQSYPTTARSAWWYDDYNWWTIAMLKASQMPTVFGAQYTSIFAGISRFCWDTVFRAAPNVWKNTQILYGNYFSRFAPRFYGGVWNYPYSKDPLAFVPDTPLDPNPDLDQEVLGKKTGKGLPDKLRGIQNTVTNGLNLIASARLATEHKPNNDNIATCAMNQLHFLLNWFDVVDTDSEKFSLFYRAASQSGLVRERVSTYKETSYPVHAYDHNLIWLGDQGLVIGGYAEMLNTLDPSLAEYQKCMTYIKEIIRGVNQPLSDNGQLYPWFNLNSTNPPGGSPGGDDADYLTSIGIYFRYLLNLYENFADLKTFMDEEGIPKMALKNVTNYYCDKTNFNDDGVFLRY